MESRTLTQRLFVFFATVVCSVLPLGTASAQQFTDATTSVNFLQQPQKSWGNPIFGDLNNDGLIDVIVPDHGLASSGGPFVYLNKDGTRFTDIRNGSGIQEAPSLDSRDWHGFSFGDYDGDGNLDLYIAEGAKGGDENKRDLLFKGLGNGKFTYASDIAGIAVINDRGRCGFWVDYDNDGKLDLFVKNQFSVNRLYKNNGNGTFTLLPDAAGLANATLGADEGTTCSFADYDNDGYMDVFFSGDGLSGDDQTDALFRNQGNGTFIDVTAAAGITPFDSLSAA